MDITKSNLTVHGDNITVDMPISKIDEEKRLVSGFASLDNVDSQGDLITPEANEEAFANFRGNIREMHAPIAVGKSISFQKKTFFDPKSQQNYNGMYVTVYVSKGAQSTWEKVLDGTLTGFSIGGAAKEVEPRLDKSTGKAVRIIKKYELNELSLVDNPANQLANILSIQKNLDGTIEFDGDITKMTVKNIFYCPKDDVATTSIEKELSCGECDSDMKEIGWLEEQDDEKTSIQKAIFAFKKNDAKIDIEKQDKNIDELVEQVAKRLQIIKGGTEVSDTNESAEDKTLAGTEAGQAATNDETPVDTVAQDESNEPVVENEEVAENDLAKMLEVLQDNLTSVFTKSNEEVTAEVTKISGELTKSVGDVNDKFTEIEKTVTALAEEVSSMKESMSGITKRVDEVEDDTAIQKSNDTGESSDDEDKVLSKWNGAFLPLSALTKTKQGR